VFQIRQLPLDALNGLDLLPLVSVACPLAQIGRINGIRLQRDVDDLDYHDISTLAFDGASLRPLMFALRAYRGAPPDKVDILLPAEWLGAPELWGVITEIATALRVPAHLIRWPEDAGQPPKLDRDRHRLGRQ
jgi:hypothetical protein